MLLALECDHADGSLPQSSLFYLLLLGHCIYIWPDNWPRIRKYEDCRHFEDTKGV